MKNEIFVVRDLQNYKSVTEALEKSEYSFQYVVLEKKVIEANKLISSKLQIPIASKVFSFKKIRIVEGLPRTIEQIYIDYKKVNDIENENLGSTSFYALLNEKYGYRIVGDEEDILLVHASEEEAELLKIKEEDEVLMITGNSYTSEDNKPLEYYELISRTDFFHFRSITHE